jgi:TENA/THI-4/PQQC family
MASRAPTAGAMQMFARHAAEAIAAELGLDRTLLDELRIPREMLRTAVPAPTNLAYTSYLLATVRGRQLCGRSRRRPALLLDLCVRRQGTPWPPIPGSALPAMDCHRRRGRVRRCRRGSDRRARPVSHGLSEDERSRVCSHFQTTSRYECSGRWGGSRNPGQWRESSPSHGSKPLPHAIVVTTTRHDLTDSAEH